MVNVVQEIIQTRNKLRENRSGWIDLWQELAEVLQPKRADFTHPRVQGEDRTEHIFDSTPMQARRGLATAIDGLLKPKTGRWFMTRAVDEVLNDDDEAKRWMQEVDRRMFSAIYSRKARFIQRSGEVDNDLVTFGTGVMFIGESADLSHLQFRAHHLRDTLVLESESGNIDTVYLTMNITARQAMQKFGEERLGAKVQEALKQSNPISNPDTKFEFIQAVMPREDRNPERRDNRNLPFASVIVDVASEHVIGESGFFEFPFAVPRWETAADEIYGRSPGMIALPDSKTLQAMGKTILVAGQKTADPPLWTLDDSVIGAARTFPGGVTALDAESARIMGRPPIGVLDMGKNMPIAREMQQDVRELVERAFFKNVFGLPVDGPQMTATEILERKEEFIRTIGPTFGQLESDYIGPIPERVFGIMARAGRLPEAPQILQGREIKFEFQSPIQQARRQVEAAALSRSLELLAPLAQVQPDMLDNFDTDEIARDVPDIFGTPHRWVRSPDAVAALRQSRAQQQQAALALEAGEQMATIEEKLSKAESNREQ